MQALQNVEPCKQLFQKPTVSGSKQPLYGIFGFTHMTQRRFPGPILSVANYPEMIYYYLALKAISYFP
jgi:hypothetical protein